MDRYTVKLEMYVWADSVDQVKDCLLYTSDAADE